jgi:hypothetical protein
VKLLAVRFVSEIFRPFRARDRHDIFAMVLQAYIIVRGPLAGFRCKAEENLK